VLTEAGYAPEIAYFECLHELKTGSESERRADGCPAARRPGCVR
jgi:hypothetical protein